MAINPNRSSLDFNHIFQRCFDEPNDRLRVDAAITANIATTEVIISDTNDSIKIGNGSGNYLDINADGSIDVNIVSTTARNVNNTYNEISSLASGTETTIVSYTAPIGKTTYLTRIEAAGTNISAYRIFKNGTAIAKQYTYFGGELNVIFDFGSETEDYPGLKLIAGDIVDVKTLHGRPSSGDFNSRIQTMEVG